MFKCTWLCRGRVSISAMIRSCCPSSSFTYVVHCGATKKLNWYQFTFPDLSIFLNGNSREADTPQMATTLDERFFIWDKSSQNSSSLRERICEVFCTCFTWQLPLIREFTHAQFECSCASSTLLCVNKNWYNTQRTQKKLWWKKSLLNLNAVVPFNFYLCQ